MNTSLRDFQLSSLLVVGVVNMDNLYPNIPYSARPVFQDDFTRTIIAPPYTIKNGQLTASKLISQAEFLEEVKNKVYRETIIRWVAKTMHDVWVPHHRVCLEYISFDEIEKKRRAVDESEFRLLISSFQAQNWESVKTHARHCRKLGRAGVDFLLLEAAAYFNSGDLNAARTLITTAEFKISTMAGRDEEGDVPV